MSISFRVNEKEMSVIKSYADIRGTTVSDAVREAILEKIEDEFDLNVYTKAMEEHKKEKKTLTHNEMLKQLDLP
jgi:uncharacterized protein (DUF1778 family)